MLYPANEVLSPNVSFRQLMIGLGRNCALIATNNEILYVEFNFGVYRPMTVCCLHETDLYERCCEKDAMF